MIFFELSLRALARGTRSQLQNYKFSMKPTKSKQVYFNKPQRLTQLIGANTTVIVAGRRTDKSPTAPPDNQKRLAISSVEITVNTAFPSAV